MKLNSFESLYVTELSDLHSAEKQIVKALPGMAKAASNPELRAAFDDHLAQTREHVQRLESIFARLGVPPRRHACEAMKGIIAEGRQIAEADGDEDVRDAGLIAAAQRAEHYEIAGYGCAAAFAQLLGRREDAALLRRTLEEESQTDRHLTSLAERLVNPRAASAAE